MTHRVSEDRRSHTATTGWVKGTWGGGLLCGTDFSANARMAADVAAGLARHLAVPLKLLHAVPTVPSAAVRQQMKTEAARLTRGGSLSLATAVVQGHPDEVLVEQARPGHTRMVVVSSIGRRGAGRWLLGSVSERTAAGACVPTWVVRDAAPFEAWIRGKRRLKILVAFDFTQTSDAALLWVKEWVAIGPCDVVVAHVDWPPEERIRLGLKGPVPLVGNAPAMQAILDRDLKQRVTAVLGEVGFRTRVEASWGRPDVRLAQLASDEQTDLIVVGSHQSRGFERLWHASVSRGLLHNATMSVVVVPVSGKASAGSGILPRTRRILVPLDLSQLSLHALPHAISMAGPGGMVQLVHVIHPDALPDGQSVERTADGTGSAGHRRLARLCKARLRELIPAEGSAMGVEMSVAVLEHRNPAIAICQAAERMGADVVCLSTHGHTGFPNLLPGTVATGVMRQSRRPLLLVRPPAV